MVRKAPRWMFDETRSVGVDYHSPDEVRDYDQEHERFRDYRSEAEAAIERLGLGRDDAEIHVGREFSTLDWIMEGLLRRAGFRIDEAERGEAFVTTYLCTKAQEGL